MFNRKIVHQVGYLPEVLKIISYIFSYALMLKLVITLRDGK